jgi:Bacterial Ig domain
MKKILFLCFALLLVVLQFSNLSVSADVKNNSFSTKLKLQQISQDKHTSKTSISKLGTETDKIKRLSDFKKLDDVLYEQEPNDYPSIADMLPLNTTVIGQFLTYDDLDFYNLNVKSSGTLLLGGTTSDGAWIELMYGLFNIDGEILEPNDYYYEDGIYILSYQLKPGTYYAAAAEVNGYSSYYDQYALYASFVTTDTTPPSKPVINVIDNNDTVISGKAEVGSYVYVYRGNTFLKSGVADSYGKFSLKIPMQRSGTTLSVFAEDAAGNTSTTATIKVLDKTPPSAPTVNPVDDNDTTVKGKTEANATITIKKGSTVLGSAKATSKGEYSVKINPVAAKSSLAVTSKDTSGNTSKATTLVVKDKTPPKIIKISPVDNNDLYVKGKSEPNATITVKNGNTLLGSAKANSKGDFSVKIKAQKTNTTLSVYAKDLIGNTSKASTVKVTKAI